ncbi:MAG: hypothetical protein AAF434_07070 [Pseudomonadota bacterium]
MDSKLFSLKEWITTEQAANFLCEKLSAPVTREDVLQFGVDDKLTLSVYFPNNTPSIRFACRHSEADPIFEQSYDIQESEQFIFEYELKISVLWGIYDLPMLGGEFLEVCRAVHNLKRSEIDTHCNGGIHLVDDKRCHYQLRTIERPEREIPDLQAHQVINSYYPAHRFPEGIQYVVRTSAISDFVANISESNANKSKTSNVGIERQCKQWLISLMEDDAEKKKSKEEYRVEAKATWPKLGERAFGRAWQNAINETNNTKWSTSGRPKGKKS